MRRATFARGGPCVIDTTVMSGLMDARGSIINNNMNVLLKNLTIINVVFLPLSLIAGIGGMSEYSAMTRGLDWRIAYGLFILLMLAMGWSTWCIIARVMRRQYHAGMSRDNRSSA
jgi:magnesium transporter